MVVYSCHIYPTFLVARAVLIFVVILSTRAKWNGVGAQCLWDGVGLNQNLQMLEV